jgi:hypothetical protein
MSEQAKKVKHKNIPQWAQGLYYNSGLMSEVLVYNDEEAIYFEHKGKESGIVRFTFEMIEGLRACYELGWKPHRNANVSVSSVLRRSPVFRISKPFLSKFITASKPRPSSRPYSPECVEGKFSEVRIAPVYSHSRRVLLCQESG